MAHREQVDAIDVTVCICTFRRSSVLAAMKSVAKQELPPKTSLRVLVVDNDAVPSALPIVESFRASTSVDIDYRHAPGRNISVARNAALDETTTPWLAFLDDDEYASPDWLAELIAARHGASAIFGPCQALYGNGTPSWIKAGDYHSNRIPDREGPIDTGYTSNVLIDMGFVRRAGLRFDLALGRSGGEDTMFFHSMFRKGGTLKYAREATVYEEVVASRSNLTWIARRRFRAGQVYAKTFHQLDSASYRRASWTAPLKIAACGVMSAATAFRPNRAMWWLMRGTFHIGILTYAMGMSIYQEYAGSA
ncbi:succinoglycan biosynthesis protein ExoM [Rhizobiales bacterium GAS191]|jgi:succinoglycan biosynthesis protein ExoM|nr:succinoglycan biosynthesis protein ExoM [Rhizobiales bacterium GAS113]SEE43327.1 succinoglycan biosynthesis protein ExoM [Rhizobiales bacterium GAS191]